MMTLPQDIIDRIEALGERLEYYERLMRSEGESLVRLSVSKSEETASLCREWSPVLREFAEECRRAQPCPAEGSLVPRDCAKIPIYEAMIRDAERVHRAQRDVVAFYRLPLMAIPIAKRMWPGEDERGVFLTPEELTRWREIYSHPEDAHWWFIHYWWQVEDPLQIQRWDRENDWIVAEGEPWRVESGMCWGGLAGGENTDLWVWDGEKAKFVRHVCVSTF